ncbi:unnamed protein product [Amoebophrya sp. A120]|nr:unnamed protein product [Amoebophrya sp. A120]|eukprot:GSA120T00019687001.1
MAMDITKEIVDQQTINSPSSSQKRNTNPARAKQAQQERNQQTARVSVQEKRQKGSIHFASRLFLDLMRKQRADQVAESLTLSREQRNKLKPSGSSSRKGTGDEVLDEQDNMQELEPSLASELFREVQDHTFYTGPAPSSSTFAGAETTGTDMEIEEDPVDEELRHREHPRGDDVLDATSHTKQAAVRDKGALSGSSDSSSTKNLEQQPPTCDGGVKPADGRSTTGSSSPASTSGNYEARSSPQPCALAKLADEEDQLFQQIKESESPDFYEQDFDEEMLKEQDLNFLEKNRDSDMDFAPPTPVGATEDLVVPTGAASSKASATNANDASQSSTSSASSPTSLAKYLRHLFLPTNPPKTDGDSTDGASSASQEILNARTNSVSTTTCGRNKQQDTDSIDAAKEASLAVLKLGMVHRPELVGEMWNLLQQTAVVMTPNTQSPCVAGITELDEDHSSSTTSSSKTTGPEFLEKVRRLARRLPLQEAMRIIEEGVELEKELLPTAFCSSLTCQSPLGKTAEEALRREKNWKSEKIALPGGKTIFDRRADPSRGASAGTARRVEVKTTTTTTSSTSSEQIPAVEATTPVKNAPEQTEILPLLENHICRAAQQVQGLKRQQLSVPKRIRYAMRTLFLVADITWLEYLLTRMDSVDLFSGGGTGTASAAMDDHPQNEGPGRAASMHPVHGASNLYSAQNTGSSRAADGKQPTTSPAFFFPREFFNRQTVLLPLVQQWQTARKLLPTQVNAGGGAASRNSHPQQDDAGTATSSSSPGTNTEFNYEGNAWRMTPQQRRDYADAIKTIQELFASILSWAIKNNQVERKLAEIGATNMFPGNKRPQLLNSLKMDQLAGELRDGSNREQAEKHLPWHNWRTDLSTEILFVQQDQLPLTVTSMNFVSAALNIGTKVARLRRFLKKHSKDARPEVYYDNVEQFRQIREENHLYDKNFDEMEKKQQNRVARTVLSIAEEDIPDLRCRISTGTSTPAGVHQGGASTSSADHNIHTASRTSSSQVENHFSCPLQDLEDSVRTMVHTCAYPVDDSSQVLQLVQATLSLTFHANNALTVGIRDAHGPWGKQSERVRQRMEERKDLYKKSFFAWMRKMLWLMIHDGLRTGAKVKLKRTCNNDKLFPTTVALSMYPPIKMPANKESAAGLHLPKRLSCSEKAQHSEVARLRRTGEYVTVKVLHSNNADFDLTVQTEPDPSATSSSSSSWGRFSRQPAVSIIPLKITDLDLQSIIPSKAMRDEWFKLGARKCMSEDFMFAQDWATNLLQAVSKEVVLEQRINADESMILEAAMMQEVADSMSHATGSGGSAGGVRNVKGDGIADG